MELMATRDSRSLRQRRVDPDPLLSSRWLDLARPAMVLLVTLAILQRLITRQRWRGSSQKDLELSSNMTHAASLTCKADRKRRLRWIHFPKTGTAFGKALLSMGCHYNKSSELSALLQKTLMTRAGHGLGSLCPNAFLHRGLVGGHTPLPYPLPSSLSGHLVGMMRAPINRIASGYAHNFHDCPQLAEHFNCSTYTYDCTQRVRTQTAAVLAYAHCVEGCMARMLTGLACGRARLTIRSLQPTTPIRVKRAASYVSRHFAFRGDTSQWARSTCIFAGLFPPRQRPDYDYGFLFAKQRRTQGGAEATALSILQRIGWRDGDEAIYREATTWMDQMERCLQPNAHFRECHREHHQLELLANMRSTLDAL